MIIHFCLREEDGDLIYWKQSLPRATFNGCVRKALLAERAKTVAELPVPVKPGKVEGFVDTKLYFYERELIQLMRSCPCKKRTPYIKMVLRKQLEANYRNRLTKQTNTPKVTAVDDDMSDEYREMLLQMSGE